jgi:hypothetical protein
MPLSLSFSNLNMSENETYEGWLKIILDDKFSFDHVMKTANLKMEKFNNKFGNKCIQKVKKNMK